MHNNWHQEEFDKRFMFELEHDDELVRRAKDGDRTAFGELVRRHRDDMLGYAKSITKERFAAEDVVQDALFRAFMRLSSLADSRRFAAWIQRIVRNLAYNKISRGPVMKERNFTELPRFIEGGDQENWGSLDYILRRMGARWNEHNQSGADPERLFILNERFETLTAILQCLSRKEREVFESFFFEQMSPQEIGQLYKLSQANVYQIIFRSRRKLAQEHIRAVVDQYIRSRKEMGILKTKILPRPEILSNPGIWTTAAAGLHGLLEFTNRPLSLSMVMGLTGFAFRINIIRHTIGIAGPTLFDYGPVLTQRLEWVGYQAKFVFDRKKPANEMSINGNFQLAPEEEKTAEARLKRKLSESVPRALDFIHHSIDSGSPVLVYDLYFIEFAIIYGYDDESRQLISGDCCNVYTNDTVPYDHLGRGTVGMIFVLSVQSTLDIDNRSILRNALGSALQHYREQESYVEGCVNGLAGYDAWIEALQEGAVEPIGNSYNLHLLADVRYHAARFFEELADGKLGDYDHSGSIEELSIETAALYIQMSEPFNRLRDMFPFTVNGKIDGGQPNAPDNAEEAIRLLQTIKALEEQAVQTINRMYIILDGKHNI